MDGSGGPSTSVSTSLFPSPYPLAPNPSVVSKRDRRLPARGLEPLTIECVAPELDGGRYAVKRVVGDTIWVSADIFKEGHDQLAARAIYKGPGDTGWSAAPLTFDYDSDRWFGSFVVDRVGPWKFTVEGWTDAFGTWRSELRKKVDVGQDVHVEVLEGALLVRAAARRAKTPAVRALLLQREEQQPNAASGRRRQSVGDRQRDRRPHRDRAGPRHRRGLRAIRAHRERQRSRDRARLRAAVLAGSSMGEGASGLVPHSSRWHDQVRRESAEEVSGHLPDQLLVRGSAESLERVPGRLAFLDRARRQDVSRRQSTHQAARLLGVGDCRGPARSPRRDLLRRGVHATEAHEEPGQARLHDVIHVLHLEEHCVGAARLFRGAHRDAGGGVLPRQSVR